MNNNQIKGFALMLLGIMLVLISIGLCLMDGTVTVIIFGAGGIITTVIGLELVWPEDKTDESNNQQKPTGKE